MKILYCLSLFRLLFFSDVFSQNAAPTAIDVTHIPAEGLLLNNGWKFHAGDNLGWAKNDYKDSSWNIIDPTKDIYYLPEVSKKGICWLRLHLYSGNSLRQQLSMIIQQSGASEIYLDDSLIYVMGGISRNTAVTRAYDPLWKPFELPLSKNTKHILAVRYELQQNIFYTNAFGTANPLLWIKLMEPNNAIMYYQRVSMPIQFNALIPIGILLMMFILHMAFYLVYRGQKGNLYFGLYALSALIGISLQLILQRFNHIVAYKFYLGNSAFLLLFSSSLFILIALKYILELKWDFTYTASIILFIVATILSIAIYPWGWKAGAIYTPLILLNIIRIAFTSALKRKRGAWIIAIGGVSTVVFFVAFQLRINALDSSLVLDHETSSLVIFMLFVFSLPTSASLFLALDFAFANKSLQKKLIEVNELSQKNIAQEREKQQLLSSQNDMLEKQVAKRTSELEQSFENLQSTQQQLIQSEKMASLGELTAGIAHEIQNPLNFVNNFSEVNKELISELVDEVDKGNTEEVKTIANDIKENEEKINHHGKRADAIVKGMLQHSRQTKGVKEPTDINALCDEYLRLSYHGLRAKDKSFTVDFKTDFDESIGKINIVPQDIGRVLLNLFNNAFYAANEKSQQSTVNSPQPLSHEYKPLVFIRTKKINDKVEIVVSDNGNGIPQNIIDKIFQPFFTTKPTGEGTGLGLSLAYDIITKEHNGSIKVESNEGEGSKFIINLPV